MRRSSEEDLLTAVEVECLRALEDQDELINREQRSNSRIAPPTSSSLLPENPPPSDIDFFLELNPEMKIVRDRLKQTHECSESLLAISQSLRAFEGDFKELQRTAADLTKVINRMQGDSAAVLEQQNRLVDLSVQLQENLNYYNYLAKLRFDFACELAQRELFEDQLQELLSELTEGMLFFETHPKFAMARKYLDRYKHEKQRLVGFSRTFLLKLFNRESSFSLKYNQKDALAQFTESFTSTEPKPTVRFLCRYLSLFPQFRRKLEDVVRGCKEQLDEPSAREFTLFEMELEEFLLSSASLSLIGYLQLHEREVYSEVLTKFFLFYRTQLHENIRNSIRFKEKGAIPQFEQLSKIIIYTCASEYWYMRHCMNVKTPENEEVVRAAVAQIIGAYYGILKQVLRQISSAAEAHAFAEHISGLSGKLQDVLDKYCNRIEYRVYPLGCVAIASNAAELLTLLRTPFLQLTQDIELVIENLLPKNFTIKSTVDPSPQVQDFLRVLPYLKHSPRCATKYMVSSLDQLVKSMKTINSRFQSRYLCYVWNITAVYAIHVALENTRVQLIRTELSMDLENTRSIIDRIKEIESTGSWWDYAKEFVSVLSTGMPVLNQLTLDFHQFIASHFNDLCRKFLKDMTFIYGKNMIEYLQRLDRLLKAEPSELTRKDLESLSQASTLKAEYEGLLVSIEKFVKDSLDKVDLHKSYMVEGRSYGPEIMAQLTRKVFDNLLELVSDFYILTGKSATFETIRELNFEDISTLRKRLLPTHQPLLD